MPIQIDYAEKLHPIFTKPKRLKIVVGGRGSTKSTGVADLAAARMSTGELWCCAREQLNSIEESVHRTILDEIERIGLKGFEDTKTSITHESGGRCFYRGLSRNISSLKSTLSGIDVLWIEEGEDLSENTLRILTASVRLNAKDTQRLIEGEDVKMPEIIITMNRGSSNDPISERLLSRAEPDLERCGYYEDDYMMVVEINYPDVPKEWFENSGLEKERLDDLKYMSTEQYESKWLGKYTDSIENSLIQPEWFDSCIDAHVKLGFKPRGLKMAAHDPSDTGADSKGYAMRQGSVVMDIQEMLTGNVNEGAHWACGLANQHQVDAYTWDCDGLGAALAEQTSKAFESTGRQVAMFKGSEKPDFSDNIYEPSDGEPVSDRKKVGDVFKNKRAQYYGELRKRIYNTYLAVEEGERFRDESQLLSFSSDIKLLQKLRSEVCRMPIKPNSNGLLELYTKDTMRSKFNIASPNLGDSVMMLMRAPVQRQQTHYIPKPIQTYGRR